MQDTRERIRSNGFCPISPRKAPLCKSKNGSVFRNSQKGVFNSGKHTPGISVDSVVGGIPYSLYSIMDDRHSRVGGLGVWMICVDELGGR